MGMIWIQVQQWWKERSAVQNVQISGHPVAWLHDQSLQTNLLTHVFLHIAIKCCDKVKKQKWQQ